jgi:hypothetical protein
VLKLRGVYFKVQACSSWKSQVTFMANMVNMASREEEVVIPAEWQTQN